MTTATAHPFVIEQEVQSSAIQQVNLIPASDGSEGYDAVITFKNGKTYHYKVEDDATAQRWFELLSDEESRAATSWGQTVSRAIYHGDITEIEED